jgi:hypothetical protein
MHATASRGNTRLDRLEAQRRLINLEGTLQGCSLAFSPVRDPAVEQAKFPSLVALYWSLVDHNGCPPTQRDFARAVAEDVLVRGLPRQAVLARAARAYPSLVRQQHFEYLLRARFRWVFRGDELDMAGLDFLILRGGRAYGVGLSTETEGGRGWQERKGARHGELPVPVLDLYAEPDRHVIGDFWLHPAEDVDRVETFIARQEATVFEEAQEAFPLVYSSAERRPRCSRQDFADGFLSALNYLRARVAPRR